MPLHDRPARETPAERCSRISGWLLVIVPALIGTAFIVRPSLHRDVVVLAVGSWIPTPIEVALLAFLAGIALLLVHAGLVRRQGRAKRMPSHRADPLAVLARGGVIAGSVVALLAGWFFDAGDRYQVLAPTSSSGCRIAVHESSFLLAGSGRAGIVHPGSPVIEWKREYTSDDGYTPFTHGSADLRWDGETAIVSFTGSSAWWSPGADRSVPLVCG